MCVVLSLVLAGPGLASANQHCMPPDDSPLRPPPSPPSPLLPPPPPQAAARFPSGRQGEGTERGRLRSHDLGDSPDGRVSLFKVCGQFLKTRCICQESFIMIINIYVTDHYVVVKLNNFF